jgi:hypothetical protein
VRRITIGGFVLTLTMASVGCKDKPLALESEPATAPNAPRWRRATVSMIFEQGRGSYSTRIRYWLTLSGPGGEHKSTLEEVFPPGGIRGAPLDVPTAEFEVLKKTTPRVLLASDGHALAFSRAGSPRYRYVALDAGDKPVYCPHLAFEADAAGHPWSAAPTTRDLALAVLRTRENKGQVHYPSPDGAWSSAFEQEALGAIAYACAHRDDPELRTAVSSAAKQLPTFATSVVTDALTACAASLPGAR